MKKIKITFIVIIALLYLFSCTSKKNEINIGVILPLTGDLANFGKTVLNGIQLAVDDTSLNKLSNINLVVEDSQGKPTVAVSALNKLANVSKINYVLGSLTSGSTLAMAPIAIEKGVILISPTASNPKLSSAGKYFFRVWPSDSYDGQIAASYSFTKLKLTKAVVIYLNDDYALGLKNIFVKTFESLGGKILYVEAYDEQNTDFRTIISKVKSLKPDLVYLPGHPKGIGTILKQSKEMALNSTFFSNVAAEDKEFLDVAGNSAFGLYFVTPAFDLSSNDAKTQNFVNEYKAHFKETPDVHAVKGYEAAQVLLLALNKGILRPKDIIEFLHKTEFDGISGKFSFDENGDILAKMSIKRYNSKGKIEIIEEF